MPRSVSSAHSGRSARVSGSPNLLVVGCIGAALAATVFCCFSQPAESQAPQPTAQVSAVRMMMDANGDGTARHEELLQPPLHAASPPPADPSPPPADPSPPPADPSPRARAGSDEPPAADTQDLGLCIGLLGVAAFVIAVPVPIVAFVIAGVRKTQRVIVPARAAQQPVEGTPATVAAKDNSVRVLGAQNSRFVLSHAVFVVPEKVKLEKRMQGMMQPPTDMPPQAAPAADVEATTAGMYRLIPVPVVPSVLEPTAPHAALKMDPTLLALATSAVDADSRGDAVKAIALYRQAIQALVHTSTQPTPTLDQKVSQYLDRIDLLGRSLQHKQLLLPSTASCSRCTFQSGSTAHSCQICGFDLAPQSSPKVIAAPTNAAAAANAAAATEQPVERTPPPAPSRVELEKRRRGLMQQVSTDMPPEAAPTAAVGPVPPAPQPQVAAPAVAGGPHQVKLTTDTILNAL